MRRIDIAASVALALLLPSTAVAVGSLRFPDPVPGGPPGGLAREASSLWVEFVDVEPVDFELRTSGVRAEAHTAAAIFYAELLQTASVVGSEMRLGVGGGIATPRASTRVIVFLDEVSIGSVRARDWRVSLVQRFVGENSAVAAEMTLPAGGGLASAEVGVLVALRMGGWLSLLSGCAADRITMTSLRAAIVVTPLRTLDLIAGYDDAIEAVHASMGVRVRSFELRAGVEMHDVLGVRQQVWLRWHR